MLVEGSARAESRRVVLFVLVGGVAAVANVLSGIVLTLAMPSVGLAQFIFPKIGFTWHSETVAHVIGVAVPIFTSYLGHKHFSFSAANP